MLSYDTVEPHTLELLRSFMRQDLFAPLRLVGGTSLALQYGHRQSVDLDLFGQVRFDSLEIRQTLHKMGKLTIVKETSDIKIYFLDGIKVDI